MKKILSLLFIGIAITLSRLDAQELKVSNLTEYNQAIEKIQTGGTIILANGTWTDVDLEAHGNGTKENPVVIKAETPGEVILTGSSSLKIYGSHVIVSGLWFKDSKTAKKYVVDFRKNTKEFANHCRFTNSVISNYDSDSDEKSHWIDIWGKNNRVDHNNLTGKTSAGTTVVVWLKDEAHIENNHQIDYNYFGFRPELGENGGETIRIGTSTNSMKSSKTLVENNTFKNCDGEMEIISNKSGDNIFRNNLFIESKGTLTLRHGNNALVENNVFLGNNVPGTGGIRIINEGHIIRNNLLVGLTGDNYKGPIVFMNGVPNSPLNRYHQVKNVNVQNNTIINCGPMTFGAGKDDEKSLPPINSVFANNLITNTNAGDILTIVDVVSGIKMHGNIVDSDALVDANYFTKTTIDWQMLQSLPMPSENNPVLKSVQRTALSPTVDINNAERTVYVAGAFNLETTSFPRALTVKPGPNWKPDIIAPVKTKAATEITVTQELGALRKAIAKADDGATLILNAGVYRIEKTLKVNNSITIQGAKDGETILLSAEDIEKPIDYFLRVNPGATLTVNNLTFDGTCSRPMKYAIVSPNKSENGLYSVFANNCTFKNFTNTDGGSVFKAYPGTQAAVLSFKDCKFLDSYRGLNLSYEKDLEKISANKISIENCVFDHIEEFAINYTRETININGEGGELIVDHCVFNKVANTEKGKIIRTNGINKVLITNSAFLGSFNIKNPINLAGVSNSILNCLFDDSGFIKVSKGAKEENILYKNAKLEDKDTFKPSSKSPLLKVNNGVDTIGLEQ